jgi:phosphatidylserine/phosphatidylglycerophosphate/cardiolipin synthase-like enzyme
MTTTCHAAGAPPSHTQWGLLFRWLAAAVFLGWTSGCASLPANTQRTASTAFGQPEQTALGQLVQARRTQAGARSDTGFFLLSGVDAALSSRIALIDNATRTLDLQYYAIHADASTEVLLQRVREAARRGVRVRILMDDFNSVGDDTQVLRLAFEPNVQMRLFNPLPGARDNMVGRILTSLHDVGRMQKRMHNKLFIADNAWGIAGGRNLGDMYFGGGDKQNFVDLDVLAAGRLVRDMSASFDRFWNDELAYPVQTLLDQQKLNELQKPEKPAAPAPGGGPELVKPAAAAILPVTASPTVLPAMTLTNVLQAERPAMDLRSVPLTWASSTLLVDEPGKIGPGDDEVDAGETVIDGLLTLMERARSDVLIISPYFVPGEQMMKVYAQLRTRGVRIRVLTNSLASNDAVAAHAGYARYREALLDIGVELYEMRSDPATAAKLLGSGSKGQKSERRGSWFSGTPGGSKGGDSRASLHTKAVVIDRQFSVIGSMNLDLRSQKKNSEVGILIRSTTVAQQATAQVESALATAAYRVEKKDGHLAWRAPAGASFPSETKEPGAPAKLRMLVRIIGPLAPEEML